MDIAKSISEKLRNKIIPLFSVSIILSIMLHVTILMAFSGFKGFPFSIPFAHSVVMIDLQEEIKHGNKLVRASELPIQQKKFGKGGAGENIVSKEDQEKSGRISMRIQQNKF